VRGPTRFRREQSGWADRTDLKPTINWMSHLCDSFSVAEAALHAKPAALVKHSAVILVTALPSSLEEHP
jgi:hypothetical protein